MQTNTELSTLIWIDLEMSGLNPDINRILEMAVIITDSELNILAEGPVLAIHQSKAHLQTMDAWNTKHHNESGLVQRVLESTIDEQQAEQIILEFIKQYATSKQSPLCGNSIYQDRRFLARYMPHLENYFHYRNIDVSTLKELARRWAPKVYSSVKKQSKHLALDDIRESIIELKHYRAKFIK